MEINDFIRNFADQFVDTNIEEITPDTRFRDLDEWSSIIALSLMAMVDEEYDITIKGDDIRSVDTVKELFEKVKSLKS